MKTDYAAMGRTALERLRKTCKKADEVQSELLFDILNQNINTEFGRKNEFSGIKKISDFQNKIPISEYADYANDILRIINGEENILSAEAPTYFCISSGTTGDEKFLPLCEADLRLQYIYAYKLIFGNICEYYNELSEKEIFGKIFQIGEFAKTYMPDGRMNGIRSGCVYQWLDRNGEFDASDYCVPKEILFPETLEDLLYIKVRFALAECDLTAIHGVFINRIASVMDYIFENWNKLLDDIEYGKINENVDLSEYWKKYIYEKILPNPKRTAELRALPRDDLKHGMIKKIWKNMKYILAIGGETFQYYTEKMRVYAGDIPIHHYAYAASEGIFGTAEKINVPDRYILFPEAGFFEFLPINEKTEKPLLLCEIEIGKKYEMIFTNHSGLYRYRLYDVIEVVGKYKKLPVVKYCYRKNQVLSVAGEKTNCEQLSATIRDFAALTCAEIQGYCVQADVTGILPCYLFYIECGENTTLKNAAEILEKCMQNANFEYKSCVNMHEIAPLKVKFLPSGSFKRYEHQLAVLGKRMGQNKLPILLDTEDKKQFFLRLNETERSRKL